MLQNMQAGGSILHTQKCKAQRKADFYLHVGDLLRLSRTVPQT